MLFAVLLTALPAFTEEDFATVACFGDTFLDTAFAEAAEAVDVLAFDWRLDEVLTAVVVR